MGAYKEEDLFDGGFVEHWLEVVVFDAQDHHALEEPVTHHELFGGS